MTIAETWCDVWRVIRPNRATTTVVLVAGGLGRKGVFAPQANVRALVASLERATSLHDRRHSALQFIERHTLTTPKDIWDETTFAARLSRAPLALQDDVTRQLEGFARDLAARERERQQHVADDNQRAEHASRALQDYLNRKRK